MIVVSKMRPATTLLTVAQVAALLNVHPNTVRRWAELGVLRALRIGPRGDRRFYRSEVERLLEAGPKAGPLED